MQGEAFGGYGAVPLCAAVLRRQHGIGGGGGKLAFSGFDLRRFGVQVQVARGDVDFQSRVVQLHAARAPTAVAADEEVRLVALIVAASAQYQIGHQPAVCQARGRAFELPFRLFRPQRRFQTAFRFEGRFAFVGTVDFQVDVFKCVAAVARIQQQAAVFDNQAVHRQRTFFLQQIADVPAAVRRAVQHQFGADEHPFFDRRRTEQARPRQADAHFLDADFRRRAARAGNFHLFQGNGRTWDDGCVDFGAVTDFAARSGHGLLCRTAHVFRRKQPRQQGILRAEGQRGQHCPADQAFQPKLTRLQTSHIRINRR